MNSLKSFYRSSGWTVLPLAVIAILYLNTHLYYRLEYGYDFNWHLANAQVVYATGTMPPPPSTQFTFEAYQPPLLYILTAWLFKVFDRVPIDQLEGFNHFVPAILLVASLGWAVLIAACVQKALRHISPILKALTVIVVMLLPAIVEMSAMYNNDLPVNILATAAVFTLWLMLRSRHEADRAWWLRAAALIGLAICFKNSGMILIPVYVGLASYIALILRRENTAIGIIRAAAIGLPLMLIPAAINIWHTGRYTGGDPSEMPLLMPRRSMWGSTPITFFTTFDTRIFQTPFAVGRLADSPGSSSFWSMQYATLHSDYLNHWNSPDYQSWPPSALIDFQRRYPLPVAQFESAVLLSYLALPVTLIMIAGFGLSVYSVLRRPRKSIRDGSIVIVMLTVCGLLGQIKYYANHADLGQVPVHARFLAFVYVILFVVGMTWIEKIARRWPRRKQMQMGGAILLTLSLLAYAIVSFQMLWLPPI